ncbi:hypothetical protein [Pedobacter sp. HMWF019]|uniref:hypothetical protein n=1 Tax=Pedobacter sp. HMWF019 TaxID=2056856 RepID=UPI0011B210E8|nr:hypothetical protein [Pedobacter sp. HMWF019]
MMKTDKSEERLKAAFYKLRENKFKANLPFLILSEELPDGQAYYEYGDGRIEIRLTKTDNNVYNDILVRELNTVEAYKVRRENGLL